MNIIKFINKNLKKIIQFYIDAFKNIDKEYNLVLENIVFSPKYNQKVPILRLLGSSGYIIETAENILNNDNYKHHLHPNDLLKINQLNQSQNSNPNLKIKAHNLNGEILLSDGDSFNIFKVDLDDIDINKLFSLPKEDVIKLLEQRGFHRGRAIAKEINQIKNKALIDRRKSFFIVKQ